MKTEQKPAFFVMVFAILLIDLFVPLASASSYYNNAGKYSAVQFADSSPSPSPTAKTENSEDVCYTSIMDAAEVARYQKGLANFQTEQISTLSDAALKKNDPTDIKAQNIQININLNDRPTYDLKTITDLLEYDDAGREAVAKEFNIDPNTGKLTMEQVKALAARKEGGNDKIARSLGITSGGDIPKPTYESFKVVLPNGKSVALADILKTQPQDKQNSCLIDRSFINGKVTFQALLNKDLYVGFDSSTTTVKKPQHITSSQTAAALNSYSGTMIIPRMYEKYATTIGQWSTWEMWASLAGSATILLTKKGPNEIKEEIEDLERQRKELAEFQARNLGMSGTTSMSEEFQRQYLSMVKEKDLMQKTLREVDFEVVTQQWRPLSIAIYGASWMGTARLALSASNQILFSSIASNDKKLKDNYLQIYINNNKYMEDYRKNTDFFGTGKITDWVSDLMETGAPSKAYEVGNVFMVAKDATPEQQYSDSYTSFEKADDAWQVKMDWKGKAETSVFEDIRGDTDYTSLAMYSNNLQLGTTLAGSKDMEKFYNALGILAPIIQFGLFRKADAQFVSGPVATIARVGIFDAVVTNLIDPVKFKDSACDEAIVDSYLLKYKIFTGLSMAQSVWSIYSPSKGLLPTLGTAMKAQIIGDAYEPFGKGWLNSWYTQNPNGQFQSAAKNFFTGSSGRDIFEKAKEAAELEKQQNTLYMKTMEIEKMKMGIRDSRGNLISQPFTPTQIAEFDRQIVQYQGEIVKTAEEIGGIDKSITAMKSAKAIEAANKLSYLKFEKAFQRLYTGMVLLDPVQLGKQVVASNGFRYVSLCKDSSYKISAYQRISGTIGGQNLEKKFDQLTNLDVGKQLNLTGALSGIGKKVDEKSLAELLNLRASMENPYGQLNPYDLYYIHLDGATSQWFGVYDKLKNNGCFRECHDSKDGYVCVDNNGVTYTDKKTGASIKLSANADRGLMSLMMQDLARTLIPNRIISAGVDNTCKDNEILQIQPEMSQPRDGGNLIISDDSCSTIDCLRTQLKKLKPGITTDLSASGFGKVVAVYTDQGRLTARDGRIRFIRGVAEKKGENDTIGVEIQAPSLEALEDAKLEDLKGNIISIRGDMEVKVKGYINNGKDVEEEKVGKLLTIITERGRIEYDEQGKRLVVALYTLAQNQAGAAIKSISTSVRSNKDENGNDVPAIGINHVEGKVGYEKEAQEMNDALKKVQTGADGKEGGFQVLETDAKKYTITTDANGKPVLQVLDKNTGKTTEYPITGPLRKEGNDIVVPTSKGDFRFSIDMQDGKPMLSATGPDGLKEILALLAAKGAGGIIAFDPRTGLWYALNGQDIPWNPDFAQKGLSLYNTPDGTRGIAGDNIYALPRKTSGGSTAATPFSIPSFPANYVYGGLMVAAILVGVVAIRVRKMN